MTRKKSAAVAPKLQGKTVALTGKGHDWDVQSLAPLIEGEGGKLVQKVTRALGYLVIVNWHRKGQPAQAREAEELNRKHGTSIQVLQQQDFYNLLSPNREEAIALLQGGKEGLERWNRLHDHCQLAPLDLSGLDLRKAELPWARLQGVQLDGADLRGADLTRASLGHLTNARLDDAHLANAFVQHLTDCSVKGADLTEAHINPAVYERCDFTRATLRKVSGPYTRAAGCVFTRANLSDADLGQSDFQKADFTSANLSGSDVSKCDFREANLSRAKLVRTNLTDANLTGADLRGADLRDALLVDADLRGALIDGANFTGANISGTKFDGLDTDKARGLDPSRTAAGGKVGPNIQELEKVAGQSKRLETGAVVDTKGGKVELNITVRDIGRWISMHEIIPGMGYSSTSQSLSAGLIHLTRKWTDGTLRMDSITARASQCPLKRGELVKLATAAWCEAMGIEVPEAEEIERQQLSAAAGRQQLRERLLAELHSGANGVKAWNVLTPEERTNAGPLRPCRPVRRQTERREPLRAELRARQPRGGEPDSGTPRQLGPVPRRQLPRRDPQPRQRRHRPLRLGELRGGVAQEGEVARLHVRQRQLGRLGGAAERGTGTDSLDVYPRRGAPEIAKTVPINRRLTGH